MSPKQTESDFLELVCRYLDNDQLTPGEWAGLNAQLREDRARRETFVRLCLQAKLIAEALPIGAPLSPPASEWSGGIVVATTDPAAVAPVSGLQGIVVRGAIGYLSQLTPFSYLVATVLFGLGLLVGSLITVSHSVPLNRIAHFDPAIGPSPLEAPSIGRITAMMDCQWTDPASEAFERDRIQRGRKYALASGLMEITYDSGAKVILEGPAIYQVESASGGVLSLGKLTARVEAGNGQTAKSKIQNPKSRISSPQSLIPSPLFSVRTPTAIVTDLGTEFGVEVRRSGATKSRVFRGKVEVRPIGGRSGTTPILLTANQWLSVQMGASQAVTVLAGPPANAPVFVRRIPRRVPIKVFATGAGLSAGQADPHWQIVAFSGYSHRVPPGPAFQPRAAVVTVPAAAYAANDPARAQWISTAGDLPKLPPGYYPFRTTFELADVLPESAVLLGRFLADNHVDAIRLNGQAVAIPEHDHSPPFTQFHSFTSNKGFLPGTNVLEIEVFNYPATQPGNPRVPTPMALLVELKGYVAGSAHVAGADADQTETRPIGQ
jgi:hypothetical protein